MHVPLWVWLVTGLVFLGLFVFDFYAHVRTPHEPSFRESAIWSSVYIGLARVFGVGLGMVWDWGHGSEYFAGYVTEKSLSVDNLFVFLIIMTKFAVPRIYQQKVLLVGVAIALILRTVFILVGAVAISAFSWVFYIFGAFLLYTAVKLAKNDDEDEDVENAVVRFARKRFNMSDRWDGLKLVVRENGRRAITPMALVIIALGTTDILFALDSIPAIFGLTQEPYIVFTANVFALMGLRQLYFLLGDLLQRLVFLSYGLAFLLFYIGIKLVLHALHENALPFINGGEPVHHIGPVPVPEVPTLLSLGVIIATLSITAIASLWYSKKYPDRVGGH